MTLAPPTRRALEDLPVNTVATSPKPLQMEKPRTGQKRPFWAITVDETSFEASQAAGVKSTGRYERPAQPRKGPAGSTHLNDAPIYSPITDEESSSTKITCTFEKEENLMASVERSSPSTSSSHSDNFEALGKTLVAGSHWDDSFNSQHTEATEVTLPVQRNIPELAEILRWRLRLANHRVCTNQIDVPFLELKGHKEPQTKASCHHSSLALPDSPAAQGLPSSSDLANLQHPVRISHEKRRIYTDDNEGFKTPALPRKQLSEAGLQRSPSKQNANTVDSMHEESLTSSAIKADAARSMLGLRDQQ